MANVMNDLPAPAPIVRLHHRTERANGSPPRTLAPQRNHRPEVSARRARTS